MRLQFVTDLAPCSIGLHSSQLNWQTPEDDHRKRFSIPKKKTNYNRQKSCTVQGHVYWLPDLLADAKSNFVFHTGTVFPFRFIISSILQCECLWSWLSYKLHSHRTKKELTRLMHLIAVSHEIGQFSCCQRRWMQRQCIRTSCATTTE